LSKNPEEHKEFLEGLDSLAEKEHGAILALPLGYVDIS
jgi:hypothetical protein